MTEEYISGYLECVSRVKDIYTNHLGGFNCFFSFEKKDNLDLKENFLNYLDNKNDYYLSRGYNLDELKSKIILTKIPNWETSIISLIEKWTCDKILETHNGKNGYYLSEYLVILLKEFFKSKPVELYKIDPDWEAWPWGDMMSEEYLFDTDNRIYIMHFGESS